MFDDTHFVPCTTLSSFLNVTLLDLKLKGKRLTALPHPMSIYFNEETDVFIFVYYNCDPTDMKVQVV